MLGQVFVRFGKGERAEGGNWVKEMGMLHA